jgi:hypothetical protein
MCCETQLIPTKADLRMAFSWKVAMAAMAMVYIPATAQALNNWA